MEATSRILHLCTYYIGNKIYKRLFGLLDLVVSQDVYVPVRNPDHINLNRFSGVRTNFIYDYTLRKYHRYLYGQKISKQRKQVEEVVFRQGSGGVSLIHAHSLFSDGGTALLLSRSIGVPYLVAVRSTDLNTFYRYALHYRRFAHEILSGAAHVVFISHAYRDRLLAQLPTNVRQRVESKVIVVPNGISDAFFARSRRVRDDGSDRSAWVIVVTASLDKNKNVADAIRVVRALADLGYNIHLKVVGKGPLMDDLKRLAKALNVSERTVFLGYLDERDLLATLDCSDIFMLTSLRETFGVSYVEALARGLPIIYTRNEGVDGYFRPGEVGYAVSPGNVSEQVSKILLIIQRYESMSARCLEVSEAFRWNLIADRYLSLYDSALTSIPKAAL